MLSFLEGGGNSAKIIRTLDWSGNPLGSPDTWDTVRKTNVSTMLGSAFPQCLFWGPDLIMLYNDAYAPLMGRKPCGIGQPVSKVWSDVWDGLAPVAARALAGEATFIENHELPNERNGFLETAWFTFSYSPVRDERGQVVAVLNTVVETTETVLANQRIELVNNELAHRMKNTFAVINAIAGQTFGPSSDAASPQARFSNRLAALAAAQDVLLGGNGGRAGIDKIVSAAVAPLAPRPEAVVVDGPPWLLTGRQVYALALAVHELATNASKYGAFAVPAGAVTVRWHGGAPGTDDPFVLTWEEAGVGPVAKPSRSGFGTRLITRLLPGEFGGTVTLDYGADGLVFTFAASMRNLRA